MLGLGVGILIAVLLLSRWYVTADPKTLVKALKWAALTVLMIGVMWLALSGKFVIAMAALPALFMWFARLFTGLRYIQMFRRIIGLGSAGPGWSNPSASGGGGPQGGGSDVHTRYVTMHLDHASGYMSGQVLDGRFKGRRVEDLNLDELRQLLGEAQGDADSVRILETYLDRRDANWRTRQHEGAPSATMSRRDALKVLGLGETATPDEIKARHRHLMAQVHPDVGGTDYLAQQINQAKDVLLGP